MITLITGAPGAGKTAACVQLLARFASEGRAIFVDGIPELKVPHIVMEDARTWHTDIPDGSVIVIDEVQRVWRPSSAGSKVPADIEALETHRHKGIEFYLMTQHPNLLHANVRRLVGRHIHLRDIGILGRWWYEWPEATSPDAWRTAPIKQRYRLPREVFKSYKSASLHVKPVRKVPAALAMTIIAGIAVAVLATRVTARISDVAGGNRPPPEQANKAAVGTGAPVATQEPKATPVPAPEAAPKKAADPELVGCISMGPRCECISAEGRSVTVDLQLCQQSSERGGVGVPYAMTFEQKPANLPLASQSDAGQLPKKPAGM